MFELAPNYKDRGMAAYSEVQQAEFEAEKHGYAAVRHQREVGTGYFDMVAMAVTETFNIMDLRVETFYDCVRQFAGKQSLDCYLSS
ncbi:unnamed protein product [Rotaria socialis]